MAVKIATIDENIYHVSEQMTIDKIIDPFGSKSLKYHDCTVIQDRPNPEVLRLVCASRFANGMEMDKNTFRKPKFAKYSYMLKNQHYININHIGPALLRHKHTVGAAHVDSAKLWQGNEAMDVCTFILNHGIPINVVPEVEEAPQVQQPQQVVAEAPQEPEAPQAPQPPPRKRERESESDESVIVHAVESKEVSKDILQFCQLMLEENPNITQSNLDGPVAAYRKFRRTEDASPLLYFRSRLYL